MIPRIQVDGKAVLAEADDFHQAYAELIAGGYRVASMEEAAGIRISGKGRGLASRSDVFTQETWIYTPNTKGPLLIKASPLLEHAREVTELQRENQEYHIEGIVSREQGIIVPYTLGSIPTDRFADEEVTRFLFGSVAREYGNLLSGLGIKKLMFFTCGKPYVDSCKAPFARQNYFTALHNHSLIDADSASSSPIDSTMICGMKR